MTPKTEATEDYLKKIHELELDQTPVKTTLLAQSIGVSPAAVTEKIKRLSKQGLVNHSAYKGVMLTAKGKSIARRVIRRHRLWETFLHRILNIPWDQIHPHACRLEHATDDQLTQALDLYLQHPNLDPHGEPIPNQKGKIRSAEKLRLVDVEPGQTVELLQCTNKNPRLLDYLEQHSLTPGKKFVLLSKEPFGGPVMLKVGPSRLALGLEVANMLIVQESQV